MAYYKRIRDLREDNDKTQKEVAEYLGTPYQYYAVYEKGSSEISFERAIALAKYYNVSLDYLAGLTDNKRGLSHDDIPEEQRRIYNIISKIAPQDRQRLSVLLKELSDTLLK